MSACAIYPPDTLLRLRRRYQRAVTHLDMASRNAEAPLSDEHLWHLIARAVSPAWTAAYALLQTAQLVVNRLNRDENRPLGKIGMALAAVETESASNALHDAQARFTCIDERLRARRGLQMLLADARARYGLCQESLIVTQALAVITHDQVAAVAPARPRPSGRLARLFKKA